MTEGKISNEDIFECKMYITDLETNKKSKEINVSDLVFNDYIEFEFGNYEDEDYGALPYKDFKFFINDYSVTFYSPQYHKAKQELERYKNIIEKAITFINIFQDEKTLTLNYNDLRHLRGILKGNDFDLMILEDKLKELKGDDK